MSTEPNESGDAGNGKRTQPPTGSSDYEYARAFRDSRQGTLVPVVGGGWKEWRTGRWVEISAETVRGELWQFVHTERMTAGSKGANLSHVRGVHDAASTLKGWLVTHDQFDRDPYLVNLENGALDLRNKKLRDHSPEDWQTLQRPFDYDPEAECPNWERFLSEVLVTSDGEPDPELVQVLQEWFGYCLVPTAAAQKACVWYGAGANGKGVATKVLEALVGRENHVPFGLADLDREYTRANLAHRLLAIASEVPSKGVVEDACFKAIVAGDQVAARLPYGKPFSYQPYCRILMTCNNLPVTTDRSHAYFRRFLIVPFDAVVPEDRQDKGLVDKLLAELPGIFNWALEGLERLEANGWRFSEAAAMAEALREYKLESDSVALWADDYLVVQADVKTESGALYNHYKDWAESNGYKPVTSGHLTRRLKQLYTDVEASRTTVSGKRVRCVQGLRLHQ